MAIVDGDADLLEVVGAGHAVGRLAHFLHGGNQQADEHGDDGDHHEQFDQRETTPIPPGEETDHKHSLFQNKMKTMGWTQFINRK